MARLCAGIAPTAVLPRRGGGKGSGDLLAPDARTTLRLRGTWDTRVPIRDLLITHEAVDEHFDVELVDT